MRAHVMVVTITSLLHASAALEIGLLAQDEKTPTQCANSGCDAFLRAYANCCGAEPYTKVAGFLNF